jgi:hypothetical protein
MSESPEIKKETRGGYRPNAGRPKGSGKGTKQGRDAYWAQRSGEIKKRLSACALGEPNAEMTAAQIKAAEVVLDRHEPRLSSIEQTVHDERDTADPGLLAAKLAAMFNEKPELFDQVMELKNAGAAQQTSPQSGEERVTH